MIVVLALVSAAITPAVLNRLGAAKTRTAALHAESLAASLDFFFIDLGRYPTEAEGLQALITAPSGVAGWTGPYVRSGRNLVDPWGRPYVYQPTGPNTPPLVVSLGADGEPGGDGAAADIRFPPQDA